MADANSWRNQAYATTTSAAEIFGPWGRVVGEIAILRQQWQPTVSNTNVDGSLSASVVLLWALQSVPAIGAPPVEATVCATMQKPSAFNGKLVQVKGTVKSGFENFSLSEGDCGPVWVDLADDKYVSPPPKFKLLRDDNFAEFERLIKANSTAKVTLIGRLDGVDEVKTKTYVRDQQKHRGGTVSAVVGSGSTGFGHLGQYKARLVVKQVLTVGPAPASSRRLQRDD